MSDNKDPVRVVSHRDIVHLETANAVADEVQAALTNPYSMGAMASDSPCPDCDHLTPEEKEAALKLGRQSGKTETITEYMRQAPTLVLGHKSGMSHSAAAAVFNAAYGREGENFEANTFRVVMDAIHDRTVSVSEAKQRVMDALENLSPEETRVLHRELQRSLAQHVASMPRNRAERRRAAKGRRRA